MMGFGYNKGISCNNADIETTDQVCQTPKTAGKRGAVLSRSAIYATENYVYVYDPLTNQKAICSL